MDSAERIGVIGSPSSTSELSLDILGTAAAKKLVGELGLFKFAQDGRTNYALGQITEIRLRNIWNEDPAIRSLIRQRGAVQPVTERQDTHLRIMTTSAVFGQKGEGFTPSILGTVPATGTPIHLANDEILERLLARYRDQIFYLGHVYGSTPRLPLWFKHFDSGPDGAGDAYHIGVFGRTGSGKSVLAKMMLTAYARYPQMAILVIDPQGEFSRDVRGGAATGEFNLDLQAVLRYQNKSYRVVSVRQLVLDRWELFEQILCESPFFERLTVPHGDNRRLAVGVLHERLERAHVTLANLHQKASFDRAWGLLSDQNIQMQFYRTADSRDRFATALGNSDPTQFFTDYWTPFAELFRTDRNDALSVDNLIGQVFDTARRSRPVVIVDLSREQAEGILWNDTIQALVVRRLIQGMNTQGEKAYKENRRVNTLVIIDEAHRLAPRESPDNEEQGRVRATLIDAARTTRKYGLGWMFISQTMSSLHREIIGQIRIFFFGFGLALGTEAQALRDVIGGDSEAFKLYQTFRDPLSAFDIESREYSFMTYGPVSPLSFAGTPLFFTAFNTPAAFLAANNLPSIGRLL